jgi:ribosomal protein S3AE
MQRENAALSERVTAFRTISLDEQRSIIKRKSETIAVVADVQWTDAVTNRLKQAFTSC